MAKSNMVRPWTKGTGYFGAQMLWTCRHVYINIYYYFEGPVGYNTYKVDQWGSKDTMCTQ